MEKRYGIWDAEIGDKPLITSGSAYITECNSTAVKDRFRSEDLDLLMDSDFWSIDFKDLGDGIENMSEDIVYLIQERDMDLPEHLHNFANRAAEQFELNGRFTDGFINCNETKWKELLRNNHFRV